MTQNHNFPEGSQPLEERASERVPLPPPDNQDGLSASAVELLNDIVELHRSRPKGSDSIFIKTTSVRSDGNYKVLIWKGAGKRADEEIGFDKNDLSELLRLDILERGNILIGDETFRVTRKAERLYAQFRQQATLIPLIAYLVQQFIENPQHLANSHPTAANNLRAAFALIQIKEFDGSGIQQIGNHLRIALTEITAALAHNIPKQGKVGNPEKPAEALRPWLRAQNLPPGQVGLLVALIAEADSSCKRLSHFHGQRTAGHPDPTQDEILLTAFTVALCCYKLDIISRESERYRPRRARKSRTAVKQEFQQLTLDI